MIARGARRPSSDCHWGQAAHLGVMAIAAALPHRPKTGDYLMASRSLSESNLTGYFRHRSRMQCNAGVRKTTQLHFRINLAVDQSALPVGVARGS
jgi:hypothetical protein